MIWAERIRNLWAASITHVFTLHLNVRDLVFDGEQAVLFDSYLRRYGLALLQTAVDNPEQCVGVSFSAKGFEIWAGREPFLSGTGQNSNSRNNPILASQPPTLPNTVLEAVLLVDKALSNPAIPTVFIIEDADSWLAIDDTSPTNRKATALIASWAYKMQHTNNLIFLTTQNRSALSDTLKVASSKIEPIAVPLPHEAQLVQYIEWAIARERIRLAEEGDSSRLTAVTLARASGGLRLIDLDDIFQRARVNRQGVVCLEDARTRKDEIISQEYGGLITIGEARYGFESVGGLDFLKDRFRRKILQPLQQGRLDRVPKGLLLPGAPGVGKTFFVEALAKEAGIAVVYFNIGRVFNMYVGNSEANLERVLSALWSMAPVIVIMDEIDQHLSRSTGGEANVGARVFGRLLQWLGQPELRGRVIVFAMSNRPDLIDPALKRPGRLGDAIVPFFPPTETERTLVGAVLGDKYALSLTETDHQTIAQQTDGWTQAELDNLYRKIGELIEDEAQSIADAIQTALLLIAPSTQAVHEYTQLALAEVGDLDWLPAEKRQEMMTLRARTTPSPQTVVMDEGLKRIGRF